MIALSPGRVSAPLCVLFTPFLASAVVTDPWELDGSVIQWTGDYGAGPFRETVVGDMTGDRTIDAVTLFGTTPVFQRKPALYSADSAVPVSATAIAVRPREAGEERDTLLLSTPNAGLAEAQLLWNETLQDFEWVDATLVGGPEWSGMSRLLVADLDGQNELDVVGLSGDGHELRALLSDGAGGYAAAAPVGSTSAVHDFVAMDWTGDGTAEFVAATDFGLEVIDASGAVLASRPGGVGGGCVALVHEGAATRVAWASRDLLLAIEILTIVGPAVADQVVPIGSPGVVSLASADLDGSGHDDLLIGGETADELTLLLHQGASAPLPYLFDLADWNRARSVELNAGESLGATTSIVFEDLSNDGIPDVFAPVEAAGYVRYRDGENVLYSFSSTPYIAAGVDLVDAGGGSDLVQIATELDTTASGKFVHLEAIAWRESETEPGEPVWVDHCIRDVTGSQSYVGPLLPESDPDFTSIYFLDVRLATYVMGSSGWELQEAGPSYAGLVVPAGHPDHDDIVAGQPLALPIFDLTYGQAPGGGGGTGIGSFLPTDRIVGFEEGQIPATGLQLEVCPPVDTTALP